MSIASPHFHPSCIIASTEASWGQNPSYPKADCLQGILSKHNFARYSLNVGDKNASANVQTKAHSVITAAILWHDFEVQYLISCDI